MIVALLLSVLSLTGAVENSGNVRLSLNSEYLRHVEEVSDELLKGMEPALTGQSFPGSEGSLYKIDNLKLDAISLGYSSGSLREGMLTLRLNNASASIDGYWEAYSFWTTTGNLTLDMAGNMEMNITIGSDNLFNMSDCGVTFTSMELDLQKSSVNWLVPLLKPTVESQTQSTLCNLLGNLLVNKTNTLISSLPTEIEATGGSVGVAFKGISLTPSSVELVGQVGDNEATLSGFDSMSQDACLQIREEAVEALTRVYLPPGTISTTINLIKLLYGEKEAKVKRAVNLDISNNGTLRVGFKPGTEVLAASEVGVEVSIPSEDTSLGRVRMGATAKVKCVEPGREHLVQYAVNRLVTGNKHVTMSGFNLATASRVLVGCGGVRARDGWVEELVKTIQDSLKK